MKGLCMLVLTPLLSGCAAWFFSGVDRIDRSRPVALVETTGGVEFGAATEFGVLTLGRTATTGPCRVHYFLGRTPMIESGTLGPAGGVFTRATIDLKTQAARANDRPLRPEDELRVMWTPDGQRERSVRVALATAEGVRGDVLEAPDEPLPTGATVLRRAEDGEWHFAGLIAARATLTTGGDDTAFYVFAGLDRIRELLATPERHPVDVTPKFRADDIRVDRRDASAREQPAPADARGGGKPPENP
jgi:hypothetical protein